MDPLMLSYTSRFDEVFYDVLRVRAGPGEPAELGDDEGVAGADGAEGFAQSRPFLLSTGQSVVDVDPVGFWSFVEPRA